MRVIDHILKGLEALMTFGNANRHRRYRPVAVDIVDADERRFVSAEPEVDGMWIRWGCVRRASDDTVTGLRTERQRDVREARWFAPKDLADAVQAVRGVAADWLALREDELEIIHELFVIDDHGE